MHASKNSLKTKARRESLICVRSVVHSYTRCAVGVALHGITRKAMGARRQTAVSRQSFYYTCIRGLLLARSVGGIMAVKWQCIVRAFRT